MLVPAREVNPVVVETYRVDAETVSRLDAFEGQFGYRRVAVVPEGEADPVAVYVHPGPPPPDFVPAARGEWNGEPAAFAYSHFALKSHVHWVLHFQRDK